MPAGGAELAFSAFLDTGIADELGTIPLVDIPSQFGWPLVVLRDGQIPRDRRVHAAYRQVTANPVAPVVIPPAPAITATLPVYPPIARGRPNIARFAQVLAFYPVPLGTPVTPGVGPAGAATFVLLAEDGAKVTYSWQTAIRKAWSGLEQREARIGAPRQAYEFSTLIADATQRTTFGNLVENAATGKPFLLGLSYEAQTVRTDGVGTTVPVWSTTMCDWAKVGQRVAVLSRDNTTVRTAVVQSFTSNSIVVDVDVSAVAKQGATIMPAMAVYLDAQQSFGRYPINIAQWQLKARAALFGFANVMTMGVGATVNTYNSMPVWDRGIVTKDTVAQPIDSGAEYVDLGGLLDDVGNWAVSDWGRQLIIESSKQVDFQWLKAFLYAVRGQQVTFLAPTGRPDLVPVGDASTGTLKIATPPDYLVNWYPSLAHRRLQITLTSGTVAYRAVSTAVDNGDGTQSLTLDSTLAGAIASVSFLETCRLASDDAQVTWSGAQFSCTLTARVVQQ